MLIKSGFWMHIRTTGELAICKLIIIFKMPPKAKKIDPELQAVIT